MPLDMDKKKKLDFNKGSDADKKETLSFDKGSDAGKKEKPNFVKGSDTSKKGNLPLTKGAGGKSPSKPASGVSPQRTADKPKRETAVKPKAGDKNSAARSSDTRDTSRSGAGKPQNDSPGHASSESLPGGGASGAGARAAKKSERSRAIISVIALVVVVAIFAVWRPWDRGGTAGSDSGNATPPETTTADTQVTTDEPDETARPSSEPNGTQNETADSPSGYNTEPDIQLNDVDDGAWYADDVKFVLALGLLGDSNESSFRPDDAVSYEQFCAILATLSGKDTFSGETWYDAAADPGSRISREDAMTVLWKYAGSPAGDIDVGYVDADSIDPLAAEAVKWGTSVGIVFGDENKFMPKSDATRAEVSAIIRRYCEGDIENG